MTFNEIKEHYNNGYLFNKETGLPTIYFYRWEKTKRIPIAYQHLLQIRTCGKLKANFATSSECQKFREKKLLF